MRLLPLLAAVCAALVAATLPAITRADIFILTSEGQLRGERVLAEEKTGKTYVIRTASGATVAIDRNQVKEIVPEGAAAAEFEKLRPTFADTAADQWKLAEWCREKSLTTERRQVCERVVQLDPNHLGARMALGYTQIDGRWVQQDQWRIERGYVRYGNEWRLPQEVELMERKRKDELAEKEWFRKIKMWRESLNDPKKAEAARDGLRSISDPYATSALVQYVTADTLRTPRMWYVEALARIGSPVAVKTLVELSLDDRDEEIRLKCLDELLKKPQPDATGMYVAALRSKENYRVNRAGMALGKLGDASAVGPLIDALVTEHKMTIRSGSGDPNAISSSFSTDGSGGGGLAMGSSTKTVKRDVPNQLVLDALVTLSKANFNFDQRAWKFWHAAQQRPASIDGRRD